MPSALRHVAFATGSLLICCPVLPAPALAQAIDAGKIPRFDVASVKANRSGAAPSFFRFEPDGSLRITNMLLRDIMRLSYDLQAYQMVDWPAWLSTERFDIVAKAEGHPSNAERMPMVRALLADRFKLAVHTETREQPTYSLVLANRDRSLGPKLATSSADCAALRNALPATGPRQTLDGPLIACGLRNLSGHVVAMGVPLDALTRTLAIVVERPVANDTGLTGIFDIDLTFAPDVTAQVNDANAPSIFTALREQLGLALEPRRRPVDILVVDHVERPSED